MFLAGYVGLMVARRTGIKVLDALTRRRSGTEIENEVERLRWYGSVSLVLLVHAVYFSEVLVFPNGEGIVLVCSTALTVFHACRLAFHHHRQSLKSFINDEPAAPDD